MPPMAGGFSPLAFNTSSPLLITFFLFSNSRRTTTCTVGELECIGMPRGASMEEDSPSMLKKKNGGEDSPYHFSPGLLDLHSFDTEFLPEIKRLGASCDWTREHFALDEQLSQAVIEAFVSLHEKGLIYQGSYMVNWSPSLQTVVFDLEVEYSEESRYLYHMKYRVAG